MPARPLDIETALLAQADDGGCAWHVGEAQPGLIVPRSYCGHPRFEAACRQFAQQGWPVYLRLSGGSLVPQAAGVINLHTAYPAYARHPLEQSEWHYQQLCTLLAQALADIGIHAAAAPVAGSFCDGRFNLAVGGRKIAGTAQYWRRNPHTPAAPYTVLSHAVLLTDADTAALTRQANAFERALGNRQRYRADALTSTAACLGHGGTTPILLAALRAHLSDWPPPPKT